MEGELVVFRAAELFDLFRRLGGQRVGQDDEDDIFIRRKDDNKEAAKEELLDDSLIKVDDGDQLVIIEPKRQS